MKEEFGFLPLSWDASATMLKKDRKFFEANEVFPRRVVDKTIEKLRSYKDKDLWQSLSNKPEKKQYLHYG